MREAVGGSLMLYLLLPILMVLIIFICFIMNYASAYRSANFLVKKIETCDGMMTNCSHASCSSIRGDVQSKYKYKGKIEYDCSGGVYSVTLGVSFDLPIVGEVGIFDVKSKSKVIAGGACHSLCEDVE